MHNKSEQNQASSGGNNTTKVVAAHMSPTILETIAWPICSAIEAQSRCGYFAADDRSGQPQNSRIPPDNSYMGRTGVKWNLGPRESCTKIPIVPKFYAQKDNFRGRNICRISY